MKDHYTIFMPTRKGMRRGTSGKKKVMSARKKVTPIREMNVAKRKALKAASMLEQAIEKGASKVLPRPKARKGGRRRSRRR